MFDFGEAIESIANTLLRSSAVRATAQSSILTAVVVTCMLVIICAFIFRGVEGKGLLLARMAFWVFLANLAILHLHQTMVVKSGGAAANDGFDLFEPVLVGPVTSLL
jgi:hypothetical protein